MGTLDLLAFPFLALMAAMGILLVLIGFFPADRNPGTTTFSTPLSAWFLAFSTVMLCFMGFREPKSGEKHNSP